MPKRTTLTFTSENAAKPDEEQLFVYYCKYSGRHALTTNISIGKLPRRKMDNSRVLDTQLYMTKLYTSDGGTKLIKRHNGKIEKQYRLNVGVLPVAYRAEDGGRWAPGGARPARSSGQRLCADRALPLDPSSAAAPAPSPPAPPPRPAGAGTCTSWTTR
jgi:hypothetical protein